MSKEQIICKYKFQNKEKFDGKPYCTCFCELCEDLPICVHNCQIFEDYKQLARKTQECEQIQEKYEALKLENQEGYEIVDELKQECEELISEIIDMNSIIEDAAINLGNKDFTLYDLPFEIKKLRQEYEALKSESFTREELITLQEKDIDRYRKALEEIEEVIKSPCAEDCVYYESSRCYDCIKTSILDSISRAKGEK